MFTYPLKKEILLLIDGEIFIGAIKFAGKDAITITNFRKRQYLTSDTFDNSYIDIDICDEIRIDRNKIIGYSLNTLKVNIINNGNNIINLIKYKQKKNKAEDKNELTRRTNS